MIFGLNDCGGIYQIYVFHDTMGWLYVNTFVFYLKDNCGRIIDSSNTFIGSKCFP